VKRERGKKKTLVPKVKGYTCPRGVKKKEKKQKKERRSLFAEGPHKKYRQHKKKKENKPPRPKREVYSRDGREIAGSPEAHLGREKDEVVDSLESEKGT